MHCCDICNYLTTSNYNLKVHYRTKKHISMVELVIKNNKKSDKKNIQTNIQTNIQSNKQSNKLSKFHKEKQDLGLFYCSPCNKYYKHQSGFSRHKKLCILKNSDENYKNVYDYELEIEKIKTKHEYQLKLEQIKNEFAIEKLKLDNEISKKELENKHLQLQQINNTNNTMNNYINNVRISKVQYLNVNFGNVIDINTFIDNYKDKFGLTNQQTLTLLENYQSDGINSCITTLVHYLKKSAVQQYKELKGKDISIEDIILPFLLSDKSLREHFEKTINGKWDKTTMVENIKKIISITNNQVFSHHNKFLNFTANQRKRIINGVLKASGYSLLSQISIPDFYKIESTTTSIDINSEEKTILDIDKKTLTQQNQEEDNEDDEDDEDDEEDIDNESFSEECNEDDSEYYEEEDEEDEDYE